MGAVLAMAVLSAAALLLGGCSGNSPATDKDSLVRRVSAGLGEVGASSSLTRCLTKDLDEHLTESDAEAAYEDFASEPEVSENALNRVSLLVSAVKERLLTRAQRCRSLLVLRARYRRVEIDHMLYEVGERGYRQPNLFLTK
ncbi:MAG TPA: hypothetical protein VE127_02835 [Solirubrobacteraceae bacterium]|nr:hypothetical protein [Solirubrobacteraceae bacterium]